MITKTTKTAISRLIILMRMLHIVLNVMLIWIKWLKIKI